MKEKPNKCTICPQAFSRINDLKRHVSTVHLKLRDFKCDQCDKAYSSKPPLNTHIRKNHSSEGGAQTDNSSDDEDEDLIESFYE